MQIKWFTTPELVMRSYSRIPIYDGKDNEGNNYYIAVDFYTDQGYISLFLPDSRIFIPFTFSQIPGDKNDPDLLVLAHQLIEKEIQTLKDNGRY